MNIRMHRERLTTLAAAALLSLVTAQVATAAPLAISDVPLFLSTGVKPNLIMAIDDSGSMDGEMLLRGNDGAAWWRTGASGTCTIALDNNSFTGCVTNATGTADVSGTGRLNFNFAGTANGTWKKYIYLFPNGFGTNTEDRRRYTDAADDHYAVAPLPAFAWSRSPEYNKAYFDPNSDYPHWVSTVAPNVFSDASATGTEWDPVFPGANAVNLTNDIAGMSNPTPATVCSNAAITATVPDAHWGFRVHTGMTIPPETCIRVPGRNWELVRTGGCTVVPATPTANLCFTKTAAGVNNAAYQLTTNQSIWIRYFPATFYLSSASLLPAGYGYTGPLTNLGKAPDGTDLIRFEIKPGNFATMAQYDTAIQKFANYFMFYRKRHMALRAGLGAAFDSLTATRVAGFTINSATGSPPNAPDVTMGDIDVAASKQALYNNFYRNWTGNGGTPNRNAVANLIRNFRRTNAGAPVTHSCQRNFGMLFTDGFSNVGAAGDGIVGVAGNADGAAGAPYQDAVSDTMADAVLRAYNTPLRTGALFPLGRVGVKKSLCEGAGLDPKQDCNKNLHMNFYAITLGTRGLLFNPDADPAQDPYATPPTWPTTFQPRHPSAVDDIWHATINGRGQLLNAASSSELAEKLSAVLRSIAEKAGSASSAAVNSGSINSDTRLFLASFDPTDWSGDLTASSISEDGQLGTPVFVDVPTPDDREIVTVNTDGTPVAFTWSTIDATRKAQLQPAPDTLGDERLDWLRGDQTRETLSAPNNFRKRTKLLGDHVNSAPAYVGAPAFRYPDSLQAKPYSKFREAHKNRVHMVYAGANDGMLHAYFSDDAGSGDVEEKFAFIPGSVFKNLHLLPAPNYAHKFYVDGSPIVGDAFVGGDWRTILVAGLNKGGQGVYALDVTDPAALTEANAASVFKWEFSDANDADLGYTYSRPSIVRMNDGTWVAAFGNGYSNTTADGIVSTTGNAVLYIVNLQTGALIRKINTGVGMSADPLGTARPNGLSTPVFADLDGDSDVDLAYAGDLFGNVWKFDLSSSSSASWSVAYGGLPFFTAKIGTDNQAITVRPNLSRGSKGQGLIVLFGTGKYLEPSDIDVPTLKTQSFYGLFDPNTGAATDRIASRTDLTTQTIWREVEKMLFVNDETGENHYWDIRVTSKNLPAATSRGWYIDLVSPTVGFEGEMQVTDALIKNDHVTFTTLIPGSDPCAYGGTSWLMELDLFTGGRTISTPWDLNANSRFDDVYSEGGVDYPINGIRNPETDGIIPKPASILGDCDYLIFPSTSGGTETRCRDPGPRGFGRQSWRQAH
jgi:type IV pilus assembly protein PilY1